MAGLTRPSAPASLSVSMPVSAFYPKGELYTVEFPEPLFLVEPIIPMGGLVMLHGPKTAGKTQLALTLAVAVSTGQTFLGEYRCQQGEVVLVETDMTRKLLQSRIKMTPEAKTINFLHSEPFDIVSLMAKGLLPEAFQEAQRMQPVLVIVDSLRKTSAQDEVDSASAGRVYGAWQRLFPNACIAIIHHDRKASTNPDAIQRPEEAARGSGAWLDDIDTGLHLSKLRGHKHGGHVATLSFSKCRTTEDPEPMVVRMREDTLLIEPLNSTPRTELAKLVAANPNITSAEAVQQLTANKVCSRATAYRLVSEARLTVSHGGETSQSRETP